MVLYFARGEPGVPCSICRRVDVPTVFVVTGPTVEEPESACVLCLAQAIEIPTSWKMGKVVDNFLHKSAAAARFRNLDQDTRRARRSKTV